MRKKLLDKIIDMERGLSMGSLMDVYRYMKSIIEDNSVTPEYLIRTMNDLLGVNILSSTKYATEVWGRYIVMHELTMMGWTTSAIGRVFDRNHSTVTHAHRQIENMLAFPSSYGNYFEIYKKFKNRIKDDKMRMAG